MPRTPNGTMTQAALGRALGIDQSLVSRYLKRGMPDTIEAARGWLKRNVMPRMRPDRGLPSGADMVLAACVLARLSTRAAERQYRKHLYRYGTDAFAIALDALLTILPQDRVLAVHLPAEVLDLLDSDILHERPSRADRAFEEDFPDTTEGVEDEAH